MRKLLVFLFLVAGCASFDPAGPKNAQEAFPYRNQDPRWVLIVNEGTVHLNIDLKDEAERLVEQIYLAGANRFFTLNGQVIPKYWIRQLPVGNYRLDMRPFFYQTEPLAPLFGKPIRYRIDLPIQTVSMVVGRNPTAMYDRGYAGIGGTYRHFSCIVRLNGGMIPDGAMGLPMFRLNLNGNF